MVAFVNACMVVVFVRIDMRQHDSTPPSRVVVDRVIVHRSREHRYRPCERRVGLKGGKIIAAAVRIAVAQTARITAKAPMAPPTGSPDKPTVAPIAPNTSVPTVSDGGAEHGPDVFPEHNRTHCLANGTHCLSERESEHGSVLASLPQNTTAPTAASPPTAAPIDAVETATSAMGQEIQTRVPRDAQHRGWIVSGGSGVGLHPAPAVSISAHRPS